jgi:hypothetical protein
MCQGHLPSNPACCCSRSSKSISWKFSGIPIDRYKKMVDWWSDYSPWSMVDHIHRRRPKLIGARAHRRSCAWDLSVVARGAREGDGDPYPDWHKVVEGLGWPGIGEGRWW